MKNRPEFFEAIWAGLRSGLYVTPVNWHLTPAEAAFIVDDCEASALVTEASLTQVARELNTPLADLRVHLAVGGDNGGLCDFASYEEALAGQEPGDVPDECEGTWMFYSSGTSGRPKGIVPGPVGEPLGSPQKFSDVAHGTVRIHRELGISQPGSALPRRSCRLDQRGATPRLFDSGDGEFRSD